MRKLGFVMLGGSPFVAGLAGLCVDLGYHAAAIGIAAGALFPVIALVEYLIAGEDE